MHQKELFPRRPEFSIVKLRPSDIEFESGRTSEMQQLLAEVEHQYPDIQDWFKTKVLPGVLAGTRVAYMGYELQEPVVSAIIKLNRDAKFCHLRIRQSFRDKHIGEIFFAIMTMDCRNAGAKRIHFTLPEGLWAAKSDFFSSFGFRQAKRATRQYRQGEAELACEAPFQVVWNSVISKLPKLKKSFSVAGYNLGPELIMSMKPSFASAILSGRKQVEVRRSFPKKWQGCSIGLYATSPQKELVGEAVIEDVFIDSPAPVWERFSDRIGNYEDFARYVGGTTKVSALVLGSVTAYKYPIPLAQVESLLKSSLRPPQSYCTGQNGWGDAASIAALLHGTFKPIPLSA